MYFTPAWSSLSVVRTEPLECHWRRHSATGTFVDLSDIEKRTGVPLHRSHGSLELLRVLTADSRPTHMPQALHHDPLYL
jgi:hypothetical protein